ncbi:response regulator [Thiohalomonas denitrificans]|uniref:Two-component system, OmpR family, KDP operon response regulator KdpE n=1 Tax=Thiohalomonas denitrificans TaxID=415747 RepID=A0A1G5QA52_9GAMM|nr:response regulator [Thiohalomonas denitrificans]SCZ58456.1 two-component system, OmpR family, KDP operon response regulator KdpE [Thiohalomonas denitrificans]
MTESSGTILIVEDDAPIRKFLRISLEAHGFRVLEARLGRDGLELCAEEHPDVVILDLGLPDMDGQEFIPEVRGWSSVPIIVLSVRSDETEKVTALDAGADDYVTKPFGISELMARIRTAQRNRKPSVETARIKAGRLEVDLTRHEVWLGGEPVHLSKKEYELLKLFINNPDRVLTHRQILRDVWGPNHVRDTHYLRVLVGHLRQRLGDIPSNPRYITTVQGVGYRFIREPETE